MGPREVPNGALDEVEVRPGDNLWVMAERHLQGSTGGPANEDEIRSHWETVIELNRDRFADPTNPSRIYAGQQIQMPSAWRCAGGPCGNASLGPRSCGVARSSGLCADDDDSPHAHRVDSGAQRITSFHPRPGPTSEVNAGGIRVVRPQDRHSGGGAGNGQHRAGGWARRGRHSPPSPPPTTSPCGYPASDPASLARRSAHCDCAGRRYGPVRPAAPRAARHRLRVGQTADQRPTSVD